jgi:hypothetical protein
MMENKIEIIFTDEGIGVKPIGEINTLRAIQGMFALVGFVGKDNLENVVCILNNLIKAGVKGSTNA